MTYPSMDDLHRAGAEAHLRPIQRRMDAMVASLPWHGRMLYRLALPVARAMARIERKR